VLVEDARLERRVLARREGVERAAQAFQGERDFAGAAALGFFFWLGQTTLTLSFAATERVCAVRGRDRQLVDFADLLGERLAVRKD